MHLNFCILQRRFARIETSLGAMALWKWIGLLFLQTVGVDAAA